jgi:hypothetical protein
MRPMPMPIITQRPLLISFFLVQPNTLQSTRRQLQVNAFMVLGGLKCRLADACRCVQGSQLV